MFYFLVVNKQAPQEIYVRKEAPYCPLNKFTRFNLMVPLCKKFFIVKLCIKLIMNYSFENRNKNSNNRPVVVNIGSISAGHSGPAFLKSCWDVLLQNNNIANESSLIMVFLQYDSITTLSLADRYWVPDIKTLPLKIGLNRQGSRSKTFHHISRP